MTIRIAFAAGLLAVALGMPGLAGAQGTATTPAPAARAPGNTTGNTTGNTVGNTSGNATQRQPTPAQAAQQERMTNCNAEARTRNLSGEPRQGFMRECLAGRMPPAAPAAGQPSAAQQAQQNRMRECNATAGTRNLAGDARQAFMRECLAGR